MSFSFKEKNTNNTIDPDFEQINYEDPKNENSILEIYKNEQWESIVPQTIETIDYCKDDQSFGDYPYFRIQFNFYQKQMFQVKFLIIFN